MDVSNTWKAYITLLRPNQWVKNIFIFLPVFFGGAMGDIDLVSKCFVVFAAFSFAASSIYCFNDIWDIKADRQHPVKCHRPVASGDVSVKSAYMLMFLMLVLSITIVFVFAKSPFEILVVIGAYFITNIAYCVKLKQKAIIDVIIIAFGFVFRVVLGGIATGIILSHWIIIMTFLLALFLALSKRRDDVLLFQQSGVKARKNIDRYNMEFMNLSITIVASVTIVAYIMYTVSAEVIAQIGSEYLYTTSLFVLIGILRYLQLTIVDTKSGSPTQVLLKDLYILYCILGWIITFIIIIYL